MRIRRQIVLPLVAVLSVAPSLAAAQDHHHHGNDRKACHPSKQERREAARFAHATSATAERYENVAMALNDHFEPWVDSYRAVHHYINYEHYYDWRILDPKRPEALVYANTHTGPKLIGVMYSMEDPNRKPPDMGGCITRWHTHVQCKSPIGYSHIWEGDCPPGWQDDGRSEPMLHVWTVKMRGGPYAYHPDKHWNCWPQPHHC